MNFSLPASLWSLHKRLIDDAGRVNELPAGRWGDYWLTQAITHSRYAHVYGEPDLYYGYNNGWHAASMPFVGAYKREIDNSWVVEKLPPIGSLVWQIKGDLLVCRTSKIASYYQGMIQAALEPAGPYAGSPVGGDSGSVCYVEVAGKWKVLGICNSIGTCHAPFWTGALPLPGGQVIPMRDGGIDTVGTISQTGHYFGQQTIIPHPMRLFLDKPPTSLRVVGRFTEGNDGTDNVMLDVPCFTTPSAISIYGSGTDKWCYPDNKTNWIIRATRTGESSIRLFIKRSKEEKSYSVVIDGGGQYTVSPSTPSFSEGPAMGQKPDATQVPASDLSTLDVVFLQAELVELRKKNTQLEIDVARSKVERDHMLEMLTAEQAKVEALQAELDRTAGLRLAMEMLGKEMGWGR